MENVTQQKMDKWDYLIPISSGLLTGAADVFFVKDISLSEAHGWGKCQTEQFVIATAKRYAGYDKKGKDLAKAVTALEKAFPIAADGLTNDFGGGAYHHLRDFSHHPTIIGWLFNLVSQFTGKGYGTDTTGKFIIRDIPGWVKPDFVNGIYAGTITWLFHMISDIAGSSSTIRLGKEGTGLPGPLMALLKEISAIPAVRTLTGFNEDGNNLFSVYCSKLFTGTLLGEHDENGKIVKGGQLRFDLRTELGIAHEILANKQHIPVILNEVIVCSFYSISRFCRELDRHEITSMNDLKKLDVRSFLPWNSPALRHMRMMATATFSAIDISAAAIKAYLKNKNNPSGFAMDLLLGINYIGVGHLVLASSAELGAGIAALHGKYAKLVETQKNHLFEATPETEETADWARRALTTAMAVAQTGTPMGFVTATIGVYDEISKSLKDLELAREERIEIENRCRVNIRILRENREEMERAICAYMYENLHAFDEAFDVMDAAVQNSDAAAFIQGNTMIQKQLGREAQFEGLDDFGALMLSDAPLKL